MFTFILVTLLAGSSPGPASKPSTAVSDADRMVCKYDIQPGSRLAKRKVCLTVAQWREWKQSEQLYLLRNQFNGSPK
jgi:hypothetical protein